MLIISRKRGESLLIGEGVEVTFLELQGDRVKIGVEAPREVRILRRELLDETREANREAASLPGTLNLWDIRKMMMGSGE